MKLAGAAVHAGRACDAAGAAAHQAGDEEPVDELHALAFEREADRFVGLPIEEFDARVQAAHLDPVPTLVVHDRADRQTPYADAVGLVEALPQAELVTTDGLGHRRILHDPGVVAATVAFIRDDVEGVAA